MTLYINLGGTYVRKEDTIISQSPIMDNFCDENMKKNKTPHGKSQLVWCTVKIVTRIAKQLLISIILDALNNCIHLISKIPF